jgi:signal transduction histidine kinase/ligand-binding sensor domain-containing protein
MPRYALWLLGVALLPVAEPAWAQRASNWRAYKLADGLPELSCISVSVGQGGKVLVRHASPYVTEIDGYRVKVLPAPAGGNSRIYQSPAGQLWTAVADGLMEFQGDTWALHPLPEIATDYRLKAPLTVDPVPLWPVRQGFVLALLADRLLEFNTEDRGNPRATSIRVAAKTGLGRFLGMGPARDGGLWICGERGLARVPTPLRALKAETPWREFAFPADFSCDTMQYPLEASDGLVTVLGRPSTNQQQMLLRFDGESWRAEGPASAKLRSAWRGPDNGFWGFSPEALYQWEPGSAEVTETEELSARRYFDAAVETGGAFWLATSDGLFRYTRPPWQTPVGVRSLRSTIRTMASDSRGGIWFVSGTGLHRLESDRDQTYPIPSRWQPILQSAHALFVLPDDSLVFDGSDQVNEGEGECVRFDSNTGTFAALAKQNPGLRYVPLGLLRDGSLCFQVLGTGDAGSYRFAKFDGRRMEAAPLPILDQELGPRLKSLFTSRNGDIWLSGEMGTALLHEVAWKTYVSSDGSAPGSALFFVDVPGGKVCCATKDEVWEYDGHGWMDLRRGFDRIDALVCSRDGSLWVASNTGLLRYTKGAWLENGLEEGLPSTAVRAVCEDQRGRLWAGTTRGLSQFWPAADPDPPKTFLRPVSEEGNRLPEGSTVTVVFLGRDKWKCTPAERLLYSYRLDGGDWSRFSEISSASFTDLPPGKHYFQVQAMDRSGNIESNPPQLEFAIILPWYRETRLVLISVAGLLLALFFAGVAFNRHLRLRRSHAEIERTIAERTRQLERANRELLHSQKMTALGTIAAGIAHDFNNILSIVKGSAQLIEDNVDDPGKIRMRVDRIKLVVEQGAGVIKALLGFSRESSQQYALCEINGVVSDTLRLLGDRFLRETEIRFEPGAALPQIATSRDYIQQILLNFIFNAAESMTARKQIIIKTALFKTLPPGVVLPPAAAGEWIAISVRDFGSGIAHDILPRIFEPFYTTKALSSRRGTGLGLSMAYELARQMGAGLAVETTVPRNGGSPATDHGSTFTLILPCLQLAAEIQPAPDRKSALIPRN